MTGAGWRSEKKCNFLFNHNSPHYQQELDRRRKCQNQLTFLNCMTRFIRLLVVALVDEEDVDV